MGDALTDPATARLGDAVAGWPGNVVADAAVDAVTDPVADAVAGPVTPTAGADPAAQADATGVPSLLDRFVELVPRAITWLNDPLNWTNPGGILDRLGEHLVLSASAVLLGCLLAWPVGLWLGHRAATAPYRGGRSLTGTFGRNTVVVVSNVTLAIPVLATLTILPLTPVGFGRPAVIVALAVFAVPPLLATAYTGVTEVDAQTRDAAVGMGLSGGQLLWRVELPLALPYLAAGFRTASVQVVATASLAAFVNGGGLGHIILPGFGLGLVTGGDQVVAGGILVAGLALAVEGVLGLVQRAVTPRPLRRTGRAGAAPT